MNRFVLHTSHRYITHLAVITRKTYLENDFLKGWGILEKSFILFLIALSRADFFHVLVSVCEAQLRLYVMCDRVVLFDLEGG